MSFDPLLLKALLPEFNQFKAEFPDEFVAFAKFENATNADLDRFTSVYLDLADRTLRPDTFLARGGKVIEPDGKTREWKAEPPLRLEQFAVGQEEEFLLWEVGHGPWSRFRELMGRAWNCLPQGAHVPRPLCHFTGTPQLCIRHAGEFWPNFVANLLRDSGKLVVVDKFPDHRAEVAYLTIGLFAASLLAIEKLLNALAQHHLKNDLALIREVRPELAPTKELPAPAYQVDHPEFRFLRFYPPLTEEQKKELMEIAKLLERMQQAVPGSQEEHELHLDFLKYLGAFRSRHKLDQLPTDPTSAIKMACDQQRTILETARGNTAASFNFQMGVDRLWELWRERLPDRPPPVRPLVNNWSAAQDAVDTILRELMAQDQLSDQYSESTLRASLAAEGAKGNAGRSRPSGVRKLPNLERLVESVKELTDLPGNLEALLAASKRVKGWGDEHDNRPVIQSLDAAPDASRRMLEESQKYKKGPRTKAERTKRRDELIRQALDVGITEPEQILEFIKGQNIELVKRGKGFINPKIMMKKYWQRHRAKGPSPQVPNQQN